MTAATHEDPAFYRRLGEGYLPHHLGIEVVAVSKGMLTARMALHPHHLAPNGYLHAGSVVTLADTAAGYGCVGNLPEGATGFTTLELKSNFLGTARDGAVICHARATHLGGRTQIWDAEVANEATGRAIALFRCTQMLLFPKS